ncbi:MAG: OmpH family outer membrane protein [Gammaproteobacteria bacterium]|jgi:outer membrane protein
MKTLVTSLIILLFASSNVIAAGSAKIGYVSVEKILTESPQVEAVNDSMLERFGGRKTELQEMEKKINEMQENYKRNELVMTEDKLNELKNQIIAKIQEFKQKEAVLQQEVATVRNQELAVLQQSVRSIIEDIAKAEKYDLILTSEGVAYANEDLDISGKVLERMKKAFKK